MTASLTRIQGLLLAANSGFSRLYAALIRVGESDQTPNSDPNPTQSGPRTPYNREAS